MWKIIFSISRKFLSKFAQSGLRTLKSKILTSGSSLVSFVRRLRFVPKSGKSASTLSPVLYDAALADKAVKQASIRKWIGRTFTDLAVFGAVDTALSAFDDPDGAALVVSDESIDAAMGGTLPDKYSLNINSSEKGLIGDAVAKAMYDGDISALHHVLNNMSFLALSDTIARVIFAMRNAVGTLSDPLEREILLSHIGICATSDTYCMLTDVTFESLKSTGSDRSEMLQRFAYHRAKAEGDLVSAWGQYNQEFVESNDDIWERLGNAVFGISEFSDDEARDLVLSNFNTGLFSVDLYLMDAGLIDDNYIGSDDLQNTISVIRGMRSTRKLEAYLGASTNVLEQTAFTNSYYRTF